MKRLFFGLALSIVFFACQEESTLEKLPIESSINDEFKFDVQSTINYEAIQVKSRGNKGTRSSTELLVFSNMEEFKATLEELERQDVQLDSAFLSYYEGLNGDSLMSIEEQIGFNEEAPLVEFATQLDFQTLYLDIAAEEEKWLDNEELDTKNDPDDHIIFDENVRTLLNSDNEVQIGSSIYKLVESGFFEIMDGDVASLSVIDQVIGGKSMSGRVTLPKNIKFHGDKDSFNGRIANSSCRTGKRKSGFERNPSKTRRIKYVVSHWAHPWGWRVAAKTKNYKKRGRRWKKYRTQCLAQVYGFISDWSGDCSSSVNFNTVGAYKYESRKKKVKHKITVRTKTKSEWVKGYHAGAEGVSYYSELYW